MNNLQSVYYRQKRYAEAEPLAVEVLAARQRSLGEDHPDTLRSLHNMATVLDALGRDAEAEPMYLKVIATKRRVLGEHHAQTAVSNWRLAQMYVEQKRYTDASHRRSLVQRLLQSFGADRTETRDVVDDLLVRLYTESGQTRLASQWRVKQRPEKGLMP